MADEETFVAFLRNPGLLKQSLGRAKTILIDADPKIRFYLVVSSAGSFSIQDSFFSMLGPQRRGALLEHLFLQTSSSELRSHDLDFKVTVYRTEAGSEVDFIFKIGKRVIAVDIKATRNVDQGDLRGLKSFREYYGYKGGPNPGSAAVA